MLGRKIAASGFMRGLGRAAGQGLNIARGTPSFLGRTWNRLTTPIPGTPKLPQPIIDAGAMTLGTMAANKLTGTEWSQPQAPKAPTPVPAKPGVFGQGGMIDQGVESAKRLADNVSNTPETHKAVDGIGSYLKGFGQSPLKWGAGQWAGGIGAAALLAYLLNNGDRDDDAA